MNSSSMMKLLQKRMLWAQLFYGNLQAGLSCPIA
jgi:hypothetical protein